MTKYLRYLKRIGRISWLWMNAYKINFLIFLLLLPVYFTLEILSIFFVFHAGSMDTILGYSIYEILFVSTLSVWIYQLCGMGTIVNSDIEDSVLHGRLDFFITKPFSTTFQLCVRYIYMEGLFILFERTCALIIISYLGLISFSFIQTLALLYVILTSLILYCCILFLFGSLSFYFPRGAGNTQEYILTLVEASGNYPKEIYPQWFQTIFLTILPIFLITNPTFQVLHHTYTLDTALHTFLLCGIFCVGTTIVWQRGLRLYQSAN